jgi:hypothetical protein
MPETWWLEIQLLSEIHKKPRSLDANSGWYLNASAAGFTRDVASQNASAAVLYLGLNNTLTGMSGTYQIARFLLAGTYVGSINVNTNATTPAFAGYSDYRLKRIYKILTLLLI